MDPTQYVQEISFPFVCLFLSHLRCDTSPKMLCVGTWPKVLAGLLFCVSAIFSWIHVYHPSASWGSVFANKSSEASKSRSSTDLSIQDNQDLADQYDVFDSAFEGGARIRQACMLFGSDDAAKQMGANVVYERSVRTHLKHAERWGYPSHILREDIVGQGQWEALVLSPHKLLQM